MKNTTEVNLDERARQYSENVLNAANSVQNRAFKAALTHDLILTTPENTYEIREKRKPQTRWRSCVLGVGFATLCYVSSWLYVQNQELTERIQDYGVRVASLNQEVSGLNETTQESKSQIKQKERTIEDVLTDLATLRKSMRRNLEEIQAKDTQIQTLNATTQKLEDVKQSYNKFIDYRIGEDLRVNGNFRRESPFNALVEQYARRLFPKGDQIFVSLVREDVIRSIIPLKGLTKQETAIIWDGQDQMYYIKYKRGVQSGK